jgi:hypothetical protein
MWLPRPPGSPITHPSARHQPLQTDPEATETKQPDHTPAAANTSKGSSSASGCSAPPNRPGSAAVRDREIARPNRQIDHLLDQSPTKRQQASRPSAPTKEQQ